MGKASKWFRAVLGMKKSETSPSQQPKQQPQREKRRWSFVKSYREKEIPAGDDLRHDVDPEKHAIAVAAATAAVAEAAVVAAQAAAAVVRLTSSVRCTPAAYSAAGTRELGELAAIKIQSTFRGYLARRALRALKGLVKIQALVRGHIERKKAAKKMHKMQAMFRAQARARAERSQISESSQSSTVSSLFQQHPDPSTPEKFEQYVRVKGTNRNHSPLLRKNGSRSIERELHIRNRTEHCLDDKILEVDTMKPLLKPRLAPIHRTHSSTPCYGEVQSLLPHEIEDGQFCTADNSPQFLSASSRGGSSRRSPFTPTKSDGSRSFLSGYSDHPNYMAFTESSKAKARSLSAPRQRVPFEKSGSIKRYSIESRQKVVPSLQVTFASKAYPGSGRLDRLGLPQGHSEGLGYGY